MVFSGAFAVAGAAPFAIACDGGAAAAAAADVAPAGLPTADAAASSSSLSRSTSFGSSPRTRNAGRRSPVCFSNAACKRLANPPAPAFTTKVCAFSSNTHSPAMNFTPGPAPRYAASSLRPVGPMSWRETSTAVSLPMSAIAAGIASPFFTCASSGSMAVDSSARLLASSTGAAAAFGAGASAGTALRARASDLSTPASQASRSLSALCSLRSSSACLSTSSSAPSCAAGAPFSAFSSASSAFSSAESL